MPNANDNYVKNFLRTSVNITGIYTIHYFRYGKNFRFHGEKHDFWEMVYIDSGNATIVSDGNIFNLRQGEAFFHKPDEPHNIYTTDNFANSVIISFECKSRAMRLLKNKIYSVGENEKILLNKILHEAKISYRDKLDELHLLKMTKNPDAPFAGEQIIKNCIELIIISLIRKDKSSEINENNSLLSASSDKITDNVISILNDKLLSAQNINLDEISYKLGFSKSYIKAQFKKKTGHSVIQFFIRMKINKSKELLSQKKFTVSEISDMLGFGSIYYFSRLFKKHTDMTPTEYINSIKADNLL